MIYKEWGFSGNPFKSSPLPASEAGNRLLAGRDVAVRRLKARVRNGPKVSTIEGLNGIGKTSVANVASFQLEKESLIDSSDGFFLTCRAAFQLDSNTSSAEFRKNVLREVVQTLIERKKDLPIGSGMTKPYSNKSLDRYLNSVEAVSLQGGILGANIGFSRANTSTSGFEQSGFEKAALDWLRMVFPEPEDGGVICIIDNLEILETSKAAAQLVEELRDILFSVPGVRWIMCGARGIVHGVASSPRLIGYLHKPIEVTDVGVSHAFEIFEKRLAAFSESESAVIPVSNSDFRDLFELYRGNIRSVLDGLDEYCHYIDDNFEDFQEETTHVDFPDWLDEEANKTYSAIARVASDKDLQVIAYSCAEGRSFRYDDFKRFGYSDLESFANCIERLIRWGVVWCVEDESDENRRLHRIAPKGWLMEKSGKLNRFNGVLHAMTPEMPDDRDWFSDGSEWSGETSTE